MGGHLQLLVLMSISESNDHYLQAVWGGQTYYIASLAPNVLHFYCWLCSIDRLNKCWRLKSLFQQSCVESLWLATRKCFLIKDQRLWSKCKTLFWDGQPYDTKPSINSVLRPPLVGLVFVFVARYIVLLLFSSHRMLVRTFRGRLISYSRMLKTSNIVFHICRWAELLKARGDQNTSVKL